MQLSDVDFFNTVFPRVTDHADLASGPSRETHTRLLTLAVHWGPEGLTGVKPLASTQHDWSDRIQPTRSSPDPRKSIVNWPAGAGHESCEHEGWFDIATFGDWAVTNRLVNKQSEAHDHHGETSGQDSISIERVGSIQAA